jgi:AcrR family transcriptional regulator
MPRKKATPAPSTEDASADATPAVGGRQRLIAAALRIGASKRGLQALGLRELAREAGLNPNTFYRHFAGLEELSLAIIEDLGRELRTNLRGIRRTVKSPLAEATPRTIEYVFDFALRMPEAFIVAVRELHGAMPPVREALQRMITEVAQEMVEDVQFLDIAPGLDEGPLREISLTVVQQVFYQTLDYIEQPARRGQIVQQTVRFIDRLFAGALVMQMMKVDSLAALQALQAKPKK